MQTLTVAGPDGPLRRRLVEFVARTERFGVVAVDPVGPTATGSADGAAAASGAGVALISVPALRAAGDLPRAEPSRAVERTRAVLAMADREPPECVVHVSSATVYGAWPNNPVPLTEQAALRPNPGFAGAVVLAECERLVEEWAEAHPSTAVSILRPGPVVGRGVETWLTRALAGQARVRVDGSTPPTQFVHVDDVSSAVLVAAERRLDGPANVTPDGWIPGDQLAGLVAARRPVPAPASLAPSVAAALWRLHLSDVPPWALPLLTHPWVVANDRLRAAGWRPRWSNEEALVSSRPGSWWREMSPQRRQAVTLGASGAGIAGAAAAVATAVIRGRRRR